MFDRPVKNSERAILVHIDITSETDGSLLEEFKELSISAGVKPVGIITGSRKLPSPKYFVGSGKLEEIKLLVEQEDAQVVLFDHALSPAQERNIEKFLECFVLDRSGLILDIFSQRARSHEGRLQVELAQLKHLSTRLVRGWTHLERQKGGIGLRGPGETQLETDRRLIGARIKQLNKRLEKVSKRREQSRRSRRRAELQTVSLVGYTNAGKSSLFNALTNSEVYSADQLFATLDPTLRRMEFPDAPPLILADTVGFIRHLPHQLVTAFQSTLEETSAANLLIHVIDAYDENRHENIAQVNAVLKEIGADKIPQIEIYNKIDLLPDQEPHIERDRSLHTGGQVTRVWLSAKTGAGLDLLRQALAGYFQPSKEVIYLRIPPTAGQLRAKLYDLGCVLNERNLDNNDVLFEIELDCDQYDAIEQQVEFDNSMIVPLGSKHLAGVA